MDSTRALETTQDRLDLTKLKWFAVWGVRPTGECACPRGILIREERDVRIAMEGTCKSRGKHPWVVKLADGNVIGFVHGMKDAMSWEAWTLGTATSVLAGGGRWAVALPGDLWVIDIDNPRAWLEFVGIVSAGGLDFERVLAVARTRRGWHVWVQMDHDSWTMKKALIALNSEQGWECKALEVKTAGGYVVWPDGEERRWVPREALADAVARRRALTVGWGSRWARNLSPLKAKAEGWGLPIGPTEPPQVPQHNNQSYTADEQEQVWPPEAMEDIRNTQWTNLIVWADRLTRSPEGGRNNMLNRIAYIEGQNAIFAGIDRRDVEELLMDAGVAAGLSFTEVKRTIQSGLDAVR